MACHRIAANDNLFRFTIHPTAYKARAFAQEKFIELQATADKTIIGSLAWETYAPTSKFIHEYGCRIAEGINEKRRAEGKVKAKYRCVYCGAYQLTLTLIRSLAGSDGLGEILMADVVPKLENGEIAHAELRIFLKPDNELDIEGTKTAIVDRIWNSCRGPLRHKCPCDLDLAQHPNESLPIAPLGEYLDSRCSVLRFWHLARFYLYRQFFQERPRLAPCQIDGD